MKGLLSIVLHLVQEKNLFREDASSLYVTRLLSSSDTASTSLSLVHTLASSVIMAKESFFLPPMAPRFLILNSIPLVLGLAAPMEKEAFLKLLILQSLPGILPIGALANTFLALLARHLLQSI